MKSRNIGGQILNHGNLKTIQNELLDIIFLMNYWRGRSKRKEWSCSENLTRTKAKFEYIIKIENHFMCSQLYHGFQLWNLIKFWVGGDQFDVVQCLNWYVGLFMFGISDNWCCWLQYKQYALTLIVNDFELNWCISMFISLCFDMYC